jgi:SAM-dependent methyltransferase
MSNELLHGRDWEELATLDPLWAILSDPKRRFGNWQLEEFFRTGEEEIVLLMKKAEHLGLPRTKWRAIDFGCGVGRLTRALHAYFPECHGVDIADSMVKAARRLNPACHFRQGSDLRSFPDGYGDFIYSTLVLQHQPDQRSVIRIVRDMLRTLAPDGLLVFQMPLSLPWRNRLQWRRRIYRALRRVGLSHTILYHRLNLNPIRMIAMPRSTVQAVIGAEGGRLLQVEQRGLTGGSVSGMYYCSKDA